MVFLSIREKIIEKFTLTTNDKTQINDLVVKELERLRVLSPYKIRIVRENYFEDKESLKIEAIEDRNQNELPLSYFLLQIQSMNEADTYWLDSGAFNNIGFYKN